MRTAATHGVSVPFSRQRGKATSIPSPPPVRAWQRGRRGGRRSLPRSRGRANLAALVDLEFESSRWNGWKSRGSSPAGINGPVLATERTARPDSVRVATSIGRRTMLCRIAFETRLAAVAPGGPRRRRPGAARARRRFRAHSGRRFGALVGDRGQVDPARDSVRPPRLRARVSTRRAAVLGARGSAQESSAMSRHERRLRWVHKGQLEEGALGSPGREHLMRDIGGEALLALGLVTFGLLARWHDPERRTSRRARPCRSDDGSRLRGIRHLSARSAGTAVGQTGRYQLPGRSPRVP